MHGAELIRWLERAADTLEAQAAWLTELDAAIGDADHGTNMLRGFQKVRAVLSGIAGGDAGSILKATGMALVSSVGGASGPLYGTFFLRAAGAVAGRHELGRDDVGALLRAGVGGVVERGRAQAGDKTMLDALLPAVQAFDEAGAAGAPLEAALLEAARAAERGAKDTIPLVARKGRASYMGERSAGHQDPGATSSWLLLRCLAETVAPACG